MAAVLVALFRSTHPMPSLAVTSFALLYGVSVGLSPAQLAWVGLAVITQQFSVGLSNDWLDYARDKQVGRKDKPLALGRVSIGLVRNCALVLVALAILIGFWIGFASGAVMVLMLAAGWSYNLGLKAGIFSVLPYVVGFGVLPAFVTLSSSEPYWPQAWVVIVAALLGVSAHFANALPDLMDDLETGINALPHALGQKVSSIVISLTAIAASAVVVWQSDDLHWLIGTVGLALTILLASFAAVLSLKTPPSRLLFPLLVGVSLVNVTLLVLS
jgi:4-hydroxybenzoate polyprenyltransferase